MTRSSIALFAATLLAVSPIAITGAFAQSTNMDMVESEVTSDLAMVGINDIDVTMLTLKQLQEIKLVAGSNGADADKKQQIQAIVDRKPGSQSE